MEESKNKKDSLEKFIKEANQSIGNVENQSFQTPVPDYYDNNGLSFITVDLNILPAGIFYKPGTVIMIRAAKVDEIQAYSSVDDSNFLDVTEKMNEMLSRCIKIRFPNGSPGTYKDLKDNDRLFLIFMIRELTFQKNSNLSKDVTCGNCKLDFKIQFRSTPGPDSPKTFVNHQIDEELSPYFNKYDRTFDFNIEEILDLPITGKIYKLAPPSIAIQEIFFKNIKDKVQGDKNPNVSFLKIIPFTLWDRRTISEEGISAKEKEFKEMDREVFEFLDDVVSKMIFGIKELRISCPECGGEVHTDMTFPKGASSIFKSGRTLSEKLAKRKD